MKISDIFRKFKKKTILWTTAVLLSIILFSSAVDNSFEIVKNLDIFYSVIKELDSYYVDEIDPGKLITTAIDEMLASLDPYTNYIPESKIEDLRFMTTGNYGGVGALIRKAGDRAVITDPYEGLPAHKAGIKAGDILLKIDNFDTKGKDIEAISEKLKGLPGTAVEVVVDRYGQKSPLTFKVVRETIHISSVPFYKVYSDSIGYIQFNNFTQNCSAEVRQAIDSLRKAGATSLILDLRGNPGGLLEEAVNVCNLFLPKGQLIVSTKGKMKQWDRDYLTLKDPVVPNMPVVVLVNSSSASASEIVSGALQDLDRAVVVGSRTFGKGLVQATRPLSYNAQLKLTTSKYYIPSGRCIQALDYTNRNEDGSVGKIPDSLVSEFKTKNGRKIYDGGGILPDVVIEPRRISRIASELYIKNHIFDFATVYTSKHTKIETPDRFSITSADYQDFIEFVSNRNFTYELRSASKFDEFIESLKEEKYEEKLAPEIAALKAKMKQDLQSDLHSFKEEITRLINEEIVSRYYYQKGRIQYFLRDDIELDSAIAILSNLKRYHDILRTAK
ncbi:MAG TPA: S41 family peptidase [Salinivirgaceae bacterium]|nr:S41 family peptidase [Salinivirgaceae bacterium]